MKHSTLLAMAAVLVLVAVGCKADSVPDSPPAAQVGEDIILMKDIQAFRQSRSDNLTDRQALDILVERDLLFQEAEKQGLALSLQEAKEYAKEQRKIIESSGQDEKKVIDNIIRKLGVSYEKYWEEEAPKGYMRAISQSNMKNSIRDEIRDDILKNHPGLSNEEVQKIFDEMYREKIEELKTKYEVKYYIN